MVRARTCGLTIKPRSTAKKMKNQTKVKPLMAAVIGLALAASTGVIQAAPQIILNTFDSSSEISGWQNNGTTLTWDNSQDAGGSGTVGCMKVQYAAGTNPWGTQPQRNLGSQT